MMMFNVYKSAHLALLHGSIGSANNMAYSMAHAIIIQSTKVQTTNIHRQIQEKHIASPTLTVSRPQFTPMMHRGGHVVHIPVWHVGPTPSQHECCVRTDAPWGRGKDSPSEGRVMQHVPRGSNVLRIDRGEREREDKGKKAEEQAQQTYTQSNPNTKDKAMMAVHGSVKPRGNVRQTVVESATRTSHFTCCPK